MRDKCKRFQHAKCNSSSVSGRGWRLWPGNPETEESATAGSRGDRDGVDDCHLLRRVDSAAVGNVKAVPDFVPSLHVGAYLDMIGDVRGALEPGECKAEIDPVRQRYCRQTCDRGLVRIEAECILEKIRESIAGRIGDVTADGVVRVTRT